MNINLQEVELSNMSTGDDIGRVFYWKGGVFRGIYREKEKSVRELFDSGLMEELIREGLVPETTITDHSMDNFAIVLEHKKILSVTYPFEWSFEMLKDAASIVLKINIVAKKYGYQTKDCHPFNILFEGTCPQYIDIGSFVKIDPSSNDWIAYDEFLKSYLYLFHIARTNEYHWVKQLLATDQLISHESFFLYKYPVLRFLGLRSVKGIVKIWRLFNIGDAISEDKIKEAFKLLAPVILFLRRNRIVPFRAKNLQSLQRVVERSKKMGYKTMWGEYQSNFDETNDRFNRIIEIISDNGIKSVFEVAGNQGFFANMLLKKAGVERIFCSDYDVNAVDVMYLRYRNSKQLCPVLINFLFQNQTSFTLQGDVRFKSDLVVALAVSHHIILTQNQSIDFFFDSLIRYTNKFIVVEFMPMGLWDSVTNTVPPTPSWYTLDWFREHFLKFFSLIVEEEVAKNRIVFFGELKVK
jgi:hypothetical protein